VNGWLLASGLGVFYLVLLITLGWYTWNKGHKGWFVAGFFLPLCWLVGALLKAEQGSPYAEQQRERWNRQGN
jgi:hypothetical protein